MGVGWSFGAAAVLIVGIAVRLALGGVAVGDRSATLMTILLAVGAWAGVRLLSGPRGAFVVTLMLVALLDLAALPVRNPPEYDDLLAFYREDQLITAQLAVPQGAQALSFLVQPVFAGAQPTFGLAGEVDGVAMTWNCQFKRGIQRLTLPLAPAPEAGAQVDVRLHLTGSPSRETDYLFAYQSSRLGGFVLALESGPRPDATVCSLA